MLRVGDKFNGGTVASISADGKSCTLTMDDGTTKEAIVVVQEAPKPTLPVIQNARMLEAATDISLNDRMAAVDRAVSVTYGQTLGGYAFAHMVFDNYVIICKSNQAGRTYWKQGYTLDGDGLATLVGDPAKAFNVWKTATEGQVFGPLDESTNQILEADAKPTGKKWGVLIIQEGKSKNRNNYSRKVLQEAAPLYEGVKMFLDHQEAERRYGRSTRDVAGFLKDVQPVLMHPDGATATEATKTPIFGLAATAVVTKRETRDEMLEAWAEGKTDLYGLSHDTRCKAVMVVAQEGNFYDVQKIEEVKSVDMVVNPAAGGRVLRLVASDTQADTLERDAAMLTKMIEAIMASKNVTLIEALKAFGANPTEDQVMGLHAKLGTMPVAEAGTDAAAPAAAAAAAPAAPATSTGTVTVTEAAFREAVQDGRIAFISEAVNGTALPKPVKDKLVKDLTEAVTGAASVELLPSKAAITKVIKDQVDLFAQLAEGGIVQPVRGTTVQTGDSRGDKIKKGLDAFFGVLVEGIDPTTKREKLKLVPQQGMSSFRHLYVESTGDTRVTGLVREAVTMREALDTSSFDQILGDSITRRMLAEYAAGSQAAWRGTIAEVVPVSDFRTQRRMRFGGYANLATVGAGSPYPAMTSPTDEEATYAPAKRGGTEQITLEMITNDDVGAVRRIPSKLARAAMQTLYEFVFDFMRLNSTVYDSTALAASRSGGVNISTTALSSTQISTLRNLMKKQADMSNSKRIGLAARFLYVPTDLEELAFQICSSDRAVPDSSLAAQAEPAAPNFIKRINITPVVVDYWTDTNNYWLTADVAQVPMIEIGFLNGREEPELFVADVPNQGSLFSNDQITYKIRHIYGGGVMDFRGFAGGIVA